MKSNVCRIKKGDSGLVNILNEVEKVSSYNNLDKESSLRLRLLAEELTGMLPGLVKNFDGVFWAENDEDKYELHVEFKVGQMSVEVREELISLSKSRKNSAVKGIMGRIREAAETMFLYMDDAGYVMPAEYMDEYSIDFGYVYTWSLDYYRQMVVDNEKEQESDELERSIVANLADDVIVGVKGRQVDIIIKKDFAKKD